MHEAADMEAQSSHTATAAAASSMPPPHPSHSVNLRLQQSSMSRHVIDIDDYELPEASPTPNADMELDDEVTILEVRRALHIPLHPSRAPRVLKRRRTEPSSSSATSDTSAQPASGSPATSHSAQEERIDNDEDVCCICLSAPGQPTKPNACIHLFCKGVHVSPAAALP